MSTNDFPAQVRFQGIGQLPAEGLRLLWQNKQALSLQHCEEADRHWKAFTNPDKNVFHKYVESLDSTLLPYFKVAALRQILDQPVDKNEIPLTQKLTLKLLSKNAPQTAGTLFKQLTEQEEPLPFLGDLMYWKILHEMKEQGLLRFSNEQETWHQTLIYPTSDFSP